MDARLAVASERDQPRYVERPVQAGATGAVKAIKMSAKLAAGDVSSPAQ